jgi:hypothetical protein
MHRDETIQSLNLGIRMRGQALRRAEALARDASPVAVAGRMAGVRVATSAADSGHVVAVRVGQGADTDVRHAEAT